MIYIIIILIISFINILYCINQNKKIHKKNYYIDQENKDIVQKNKEYTVQYNILCKDLENIKNKINEKQLNYEQLKSEEHVMIDKINQLNETAKNVYKDAEIAAKNSYDNYCSHLNEQKIIAKEGYDSYEKLLKESYINIQKELLIKSEEIQKDLKKIKASRDALIQAQIREKEIKEKKSFYSLCISEEDKADILKLEQLRKTFNKPRVISMLIWSTYYQKLLKSKTAEILSTTETVTGIYKITNLVTNECYIGQAVS